MSNLIKRQDAIDTLLKAAHEDGAYGYIDAKTAVDVLNGLPEEEPEWTMDDLIVRGDAIDAMTDENIIRNLDSVHDCALNRIKRSMMRILAGLPSAEPERKKGKWIDSVCCSECGWVHETESGFIGLATEFNYCPNCGADMRGGKHETDNTDESK